MTLPDFECDRCGAPIKYVRLLPWNTQVIINADPCNPYTDMAHLYRVHPNNAHGRIDCVMHIGDDAAIRDRIRFAYTAHKHTCTQPIHAKGRKKQAEFGPRKPPIQADDVVVDDESQTYP
jgi:hypothetical protein